MYELRKSTAEDIDDILSIYESARKFMRENGNMHQWNGAYPSRQTVEEDIANGVSHVVYDTQNENKNVCVFALIPGPDVTYKKIYDGKWINDKDYFVIHRIAVAEHRKGIASFVFERCLNEHPVLRIDTHKDNIPMRKLLEKNGFEYCGIIHLLSGEERLAFQKEK